MGKTHGVAERLEATLSQSDRELTGDSSRCAGVVEGHGAHADGAGTREDELERIEPGANPAHPEDGHVRHGGVDLVDAPHRHGPDRGAGKAAGDARQCRAHRVGVDHHAEQRVDERQPVSTRVDDGLGDRDDVGDIGRELGEHRHTGIGVAAYGVDDIGGGVGLAREHKAAILDVGARDVDLDRGDVADVTQARGQPRVLIDGSAGDGHHCPSAAVPQPLEILLEERVDAGALKPDRVEHAARRLSHARGRTPRTRVEHDALGDDGTDLGDVEELIELATRSGATRRRENG